MSNNKRDREKKLQEESFPKVHVNCEKPIYRNFHKTIENTDFLTLRFLHI